MTALVLALSIAAQVAPSPPESVPPWAAALDPASLSFDPATLSDEERRKVVAIIDGIVAGTDEIVGGEVQISGYWQTDSGKRNDYAAELLFTPDWVRWRRETHRGPYLFGRNSEESFSVRPGGSERRFVTVYPQSADSEVTYAQPIHVGKLPLGTWTFVSAPTQTDAMWERSRVKFVLDRLRRYVEHADGIVELVFEIGIDPSASASIQAAWSRIVLDGRSGGHPMIAEEWIVPPEKAQPALNWTSHTEWESRDGYWCPIRWTTARPGRSSAELTFNWLRVGATADESEFSLSNVHLPDGTLVWDHRLGESVLREKVGAERIRQRGNLAPVPPTAPRWRTGLVIANLVLLCGVGIVAWLRRRRRIAPSGPV